MAEQYDVLVAGSYFCDMVFTGLPEMPQLGRDIFSRNFAIVPGGSYYMVLALHRLQVKVGWAGHFGTDLFSRFIQEEAAAEGIDPHLFQTHDYPVRRVAASFSFENERGFVSYADDMESLIPLDMVTTYQPRCVILHSLHFWKQVNDLQQLKNRDSFKLVLDCQDTQLNLQSEGLAEALSQVDVFIPNEAEACLVTGEKTAEGALERLAEIVPLVVIKYGKNGAIAQRGSEIVHVPALKVKTVDTTGAGDCFNAGFVIGYLRDQPLETCLRYGNITGGLSTTAPGAQAVPFLEKLEEIAGNYDHWILNC